LLKIIVVLKSSKKSSCGTFQNFYTSPSFLALRKVLFDAFLSFSTDKKVLIDF